ncbi:acyltransferase family protein [Flavobacterium sp. Sd200]|uniref:acyltransferase family protein n=1 Tax=Flavobacterium sp. Sd200 TaxID=2692211 RepID=UPI001368E330|nr:acyltransferase family protein [Flavobacterium sp. Sd200]MXN93125.1 acyltransferase family protein [Flavobacterium sp. Sd200]
MVYRKDIQGLRALAVIFVFIFHLDPAWLPGGYIGVDIFFVLSGFLMGSIIFEALNTDSFSFIRFYTARLKRIAPAYYFMLLCTAFAGAVILLGKDISSFKRELMHSVIFNSNYCYAKMNSYFGMELRQNPLVHTWTIAVEMKFYLLLPTLLLFTKRKYLLNMLSIIAMVLLLYSVYEIQFSNHKTEAYYSLLLRIPEFFAGILISPILSPRLRTLSKETKNIMGFGGVIILILCALFFNDKTDFPGIFALLPCVGTVLILISDYGFVHSMLARKPIVYIGALSYSVYLWHWPIMAFIRYYSGDNAPFSVVEIITVILLTLGASFISYTFIENFFRKRSTKVFIYGMFPFTCLLLVFLIYVPQFNQYFSNIPKEYSGPVIGLKSHNKSYVETFGDTLSKTSSILLIGNSHALSLKPYFNYLGLKEHFSFRTITTNSYVAINGIDGKEVMLNGRYGDFTDSQKLLPVTQKEIEKSKIIILVTSSLDIVPSLIPAIKDLASNLKIDQHLILIGTFPTLDKNPLQVNRGVLKNKNREQNYKLKYRFLNNEISQLIQEHSNVHYFDLGKSNIYKNAPFYNDTLMYYDAKHLNAFGATVLAKDTGERFMRLLDSIK